MPQKLILIDGNSLLHRAYHALPPLSTADGLPTNAVYGLAQMLIKLLNETKPDAALVAFDAKGKTFRHEQYDGYKAGRPAAPEDLSPQFDLARELVDALGLRHTELEGYEADDIIGTLARLGEQEGLEVLVVTGDRDLLQLVDQRITVMATLRGVGDMRTFDEAAVREHYGLSPRQIVDLKSLEGDPSDNIPGVPGIGRKTAQALLQQYGTLEEVLAHADEVKAARARNALKDNAAQAVMSKQLAQLHTEVPLGLKPADLHWDGYKLRKLGDLLARLEFHKLLERLPSEEVSFDQELAGVDKVIAQARACGSVCVVAVKLPDQAVGVALMARDAQDVAWEVLGQRQEIGGLFGEETSGQADRQALGDLLADPQVVKLGADLKGAATDLAGTGAQLHGCLFDAAVASYLIAPQRKSHSLNVLASTYLHEPLALPGKQSGPEQWAAWAQAGAALIPRLQEALRAELDSRGLTWLFETVEMPLVEVLREMEAAGIAVDRARLAHLGGELNTLLANLRVRLYEAAGHEFNVDSPQQLGTVLFDELKLPKGRKTKTGYSTGSEILEELAAEHEIARLVTEYREYAKLRSTYVEGLLGQIDPVTRRLHTTFEQTVTATGRLSSRNPNLQNIPVRTEWGREIRACFVAPNDGFLLISSDYSQIELRILAHMSGDPVLVEAFNEGHDVHASTAASIFGVPLDQVDSGMRRVAKTVNYAVLYGMGAGSLSQSLGISRSEATDFIAAYNQRLSGVRRFMELLLQQAREDGFVETVCGRRRPAPELQSPNPGTRAYAERAAGNAPLQGSAADIMKIAMVRIAADLPQRFPEARLLLQVHDELVLEAPARNVQETSAYVKGAMERAWKLAVPLVADVKVGANWRDMSPIL